MKKALTYIASGFIGGLLCFLLFKSSLKTEIRYVESPTKAVPVRQTTVLVGPDFVDAAKISTPTVVHIYAEESEESARVRYQNRRNQRSNGFSMEDFFGGDFFGRNYYRQQNGSGSGVIISGDGYIVTNNHVVGFADRMTVTTNDGKKYDAVKIGTDPSSDLAVIKIEADNLQSIEFGNSDKLQIGEWVVAVGNPFDYLTSTVTAGIVSAKGRSLDIIKDENPIEEFIQTDAVVNPGNSGGALVNTKGELIGINTAIATPTGVYAGYSFAIPSNLVKPRVEEIIKYGNHEKASLGIGGYDLDENLINEFKLKAKKGFYVDDIDARSPAKLAGLLPGDVIIKINNAKIETFDDISEVMKRSNVGDRLDIYVNRNGKEKKIPTNLKKGI